MKIKDVTQVHQAVAVRAAASAVIETLELRRLLSTAPFASVSAGVLSVMGNSKANHINVGTSGSNLVVTLDGQIEKFNTAGIVGVMVNGVGGNDAMALQTSLPATLIGGSGDDSIVGGGGADSIEGDAGIDSLNGGGGNDSIYGNSGDDHLDGGTGTNQLVGGDGADVADYSAHASINIDAAANFVNDPTRPVPVTIKKGGGASVDVFAIEPQFHIIGTPGNDNIVLEFNGNATVEGGAGDDYLNGESTANFGIVKMYGGDGNDRFYEHEDDGGKYFYGGNGNDTLTATNGTGFDGGAGIDTQDDSDLSAPGEYKYFTAGPGVENLILPGAETGLIINGNDQDNHIVAINDSNCTVHGQGGDDLIQFSGYYTQDEGNNLIYGDDGNDTIQGDDGDFGGDQLIGGAGDDSLRGGAANDTLEGDDGDDHCDGGLGTNTLDGGAGNNVLDYSSETGSTFDIRSYSSLVVNRNNGAGIDNIAKVEDEFESMIATPGDDKVTYWFDGSGGTFTIQGGDGNDTIAPTGGSTDLGEIDAGAGNDSIYITDSFASTILGGNGDDTITDRLGGGEAYYTIDGGSGFDTDNVDPDPLVTAMKTAEFTVPAGVEQYSVWAEHNLLVYGNNLDNIINVNAANVTVYGMGGDDQITAEAFNSSPDYTAVGHLLIDGGDGNDKLHGTAVLDSTIIGGAGNDSLTGDGNFGTGYAPAIPNFLLDGDDGDDHLYGGPGNDTLDGGAGQDAIYANDGFKDTVDGGTGFDNVKWDKGLDVVTNIEGAL